MKIQNDFSRTAVTRLPEAKPTAAAEVKGNKPPQSTGFDTASSFAPQAKAPVNLTGALREPPKAGPVALDSAAGQAAIQKTFGLGDDTSEWRDQFIAWVDNYGADAWTGHPIYPQATTNHREVLTLAYEAGIEVYYPVCLPSMG